MEMTGKRTSDDAALLNEQDAATVMKKFMERDPGEIRFNMIAMCAKKKE